MAKEEKRERSHPLQRRGLALLRLERQELDYVISTPKASARMGASVITSMLQHTHTPLLWMGYRLGEGAIYTPPEARR